MAMSRKNYEETAAIIKRQHDGADALATYQQPIARLIITDVANELANMFKRDNGRFDRDKFIAACGL